jgi:hypothetical protein
MEPAYGSPRVSPCYSCTQSRGSFPATPPHSPRGGDVRFIASCSDFSVLKSTPRPLKSARFPQFSAKAG